MPSIRTSHYTFLLSGAFPALRDSSPGAIDEPALPALRNIVIVNHTTDREKYRKDLHGLKGTIDWREVMMWREDGREANELKEISKSLNKDDVINLQFTRCACQTHHLHSLLIMSTSGTTGNPKAVSVNHTPSVPLHTR